MSLEIFLVINVRSGYKLVLDKLLKNVGVDLFSEPI